MYPSKKAAGNYYSKGIVQVDAGKFEVYGYNMNGIYRNCDPDQVKQETTGLRERREPSKGQDGEERKTRRTMRHEACYRLFGGVRPYTIRPFA